MTRGLSSLIVESRARRRFGALVGVAVLTMALAACQNPYQPVDMPDAAIAGCDVLVGAPAGHDCLLPWPNDAYTTASTSTGRQMNIPAGLTPQNSSGVPIDPTYQNRADGFSPDSTILVPVPNLGLTQSGIATSLDIGDSIAPNAPIVIVDTVTKARIPYFAELDHYGAGSSSQLLLVHPAVALSEGHRYAVALRNLVDTSGNPIAPLPSTTAALAGTLQPAGRGAHIRYVIQNDLASTLNGQVPYLAWDFTVASGTSLAMPALLMHTQAYNWLTSHHAPTPGHANPTANDDAPPFTITKNTVNSTTGVRDVQGTFSVPLFLTDTTQYSSMVTDANGNPTING
ncbi:MAG: hypothetical protein JST73_12490, partial [Actinobacteria bacterium]|nr:hypothetical protein [Actinomycetota bacterium]